MLCQILETTAALMKAQSEEDAKGGNGANEARRWTGVRTIVEARSLLKSLFRAAAGHKAQVQDHALPKTPTMPTAPGRPICLQLHLYHSLCSASRQANCWGNLYTSSCDTAGNLSQACVALLSQNVGKK